MPNTEIIRAYLLEPGDRFIVATPDKRYKDNSERERVVTRVTTTTIYYATIYRSKCWQGEAEKYQSNYPLHKRKGVKGGFDQMGVNSRERVTLICPPYVRSKFSFHHN